ncbi:hypothetical protein Acr_06g0007890 [Actinidia rufa]|uniref:Uncharacterized protein n=1 Tax=Actinidia rufa TaxID=165716 RepID=A0A7J0ES77_9ERIC|nr:hypothetical protein Acr_06g0007890 [Actinidia rufa]
MIAWSSSGTSSVTTSNKFMVNSENSIEVIYYALFKQLKLAKANLKPARAPLVGLNTQAHRLLRTMILKVRASSQELETEFVVVDIHSLYNAIVGRDWLQKMKVVTSTLYQVIKCASLSSEETLYEDQVIVKQCYLTTMSIKASMKKMQFVEEESEVLEDVGRTSEDKVVEDLILYELDEWNSDRYFLVGSNMKEQQRTELIKFLKANIEVFAWTPYEMLGIDLNFIRHEFNVMIKA